MINKSKLELVLSSIKVKCLIFNDVIYVENAKMKAEIDAKSELSKRFAGLLELYKRDVAYQLFNADIQSQDISQFKKNKKVKFLNKLLDENIKFSSYNYGYHGGSDQLQFMIGDIQHSHQYKIATIAAILYNKTGEMFLKDFSDYRSYWSYSWRCNADHLLSSINDIQDCLYIIDEPISESGPLGIKIFELIDSYKNYVKKEFPQENYMISLSNND